MPVPSAVPHEVTALPGVVLIRPKRFGDERGYFAETFHAAKWAEAGIDVTFVQDNQSLSAPAGTVRGLHYQVEPSPQAKLVRVIQGRILDVAVDIRRSSETFGQHVTAELTADGGEQMFVPAGFAHGFSTLEPNTIVAYKVSGLYDPSSERGIAWNDPALGIDWRLPGEPTLSGKDAKYPRLSEQADVYA
jgi:dTDP-4-dehydrorhamnose 3,5-epimerase